MLKNKFLIGQEVEYVIVVDEDNTPIYKFGVVISIHLGEDNINIFYVVRSEVNYFSPLLEEVIKFLDARIAEENIRENLRD